MHVTSHCYIQPESGFEESDAVFGKHSLREPRGQGMLRDHALFRRRLFGRLLALRAPHERERFRCKAVSALLSQLISSII